MISNEDYDGVINQFERLVKTPPAIRQQVAERKLEAELASQRQNPIFKKGLASQQKKRNSGKATSAILAPASTVLESDLHNLIVEHPYLLHTPELYVGGLYLEALINKYRLPSGHITDFTYITVQDRVVKITLVEIEKASKRVFHSKPANLGRFRSETTEAVDQVRSWQVSMRHDALRETLMLNLKQLFLNYPVGIFDGFGNLSELARIEIGYVLIVGNEKPTKLEHQQLVDELYLNENIIFMTYPEMIDLVRQHRHDKNVLKHGPDGVQAVTIRVREALEPIASQLGIEMPSSHDPYGIKLAGLGWRLRDTGKSNLVMHPASVKTIFYRSKGVCEKPGCSKRVVIDRQVFGALTPIYSFFDNGSDIPSYWSTKFVALTCHEHEYNINAAEQYFLGKPHPLNNILAVRWPYRADLDQEALIASSYWIDNWLCELPGVLELDSENDFEMITNLRQWARVIISLPRRCQELLARIVDAHFLGSHKSNPPRYSHLVTTDILYEYLLKARVIRVNDDADKGKKIEPAVFDLPFIEHIKKLFGGRAMMAMEFLCLGELSSLPITLRSQRRQMRDEEAARKANEERARQRGW